MFLDCIYTLISIFKKKNKKNIILIYFQVKRILKNNPTTILNKIFILYYDNFM
jgi:hypothetical protein